MKITFPYRKLTIIIAILLLAALCISCAGAEELILNGSFEEIDEYGEPENWYTDAYILDPGYSFFAVETDADAPDGEHYVTIRNEDLNDARYVQTVDVEPESMYHVSFRVRADEITDGHGANISVEGLYVFSEGVYDTDGEWTTVDWYGETGEDQDTVTLFVRLGGYSGESVGKASFDMISMVRTEELPEEIVADRWYRLNTGIDESRIAGDDAEDSEKNSRVTLTIMIIIYSVLFCSVLFAVRRKDKLDPENENKYNFAFAFCLFISLVLRVILSAGVSGYAVDVNCFLSWGNTMRLNGPALFYESTGFCDYPPAYTYILALNSIVSGLLKNLMPGVSPQIIERIVFRFIPSLADLGICWLIRGRMLKQGYTGRISFTVGSLLAFFPVSILNSACWGQMDSVLCLLLLLVAIWTTERKWELSLPVYMLSVLVKPQALMLGFLGLTAIIVCWIKYREDRKKILKGLLFSVLILAVIVIPFTVHQDPFWLVEQYKETLASYPYATVNTANYYYLMGGNWSGIEKSATVPACMVLSLLSAAYFLYLNTERKKAGSETLRTIEILISAAFTLWFAFAGILGRFSWQVIGWSAMAYAFIVTLPPMIRSGNIRYLSLYGGLLFILLYVFGIKMHERYLIPAFALLMYAWISLKDDRILLVLLVSGATVFLNEGIVLDNSIRLGSAMGHLNIDTVWLADILSVLNIANAVFAVYAFRKIASGAEPLELNPVSGTKITGGSEESVPDNRILDWKKKDTLIVIAISVIYAVITFTTLGSTKAPQNAWISSSSDEQIIIDFGDEYEDFTMLYFSRVSRNDFSVSVSMNGEMWSDPVKAHMNEGECYKWKYLCDYWTDGNGNRTYVSTGNLSDARRLSGRYVCITADQIGLTLCEVIFRDSEQNQITGCSIVSQDNAVTDSPNYSDAGALLDEQDTMKAVPDPFGLREDDIPQPCWYNGTYFDEIYHARTAYEHIQGTVPYETSHPPLGKLIMSLGILIFGMTPFGWRFAGAMAGVLMIPAIYLLVKQLTKKTKFATVAALLISLDCMHLTQTQIATIDSFPVLFIILSYFFMLRFLQTDFRKYKVRQILPDLALCGFFMGCGIASKWIGIYAGAGLAVLYFWHGIRCILLTADDIEKKEAFNKFVKLCLFCLIFFVAVPAIIYLLCYIPYFAYDRSIRDLPTFIKRVINSQIGMFNYHSTPGLGMDHPFYSPWYEWPVIKRPMYYAAGYYISGNGYDSAIFSFGNPAVWFAAIPCFIFGLFLLLKERHYTSEGLKRTGNWHIEAYDHDPTMLFMTVGFLAQFLPWVLVPRGTYIYHYFASIPFLILFIVITLYYIEMNFPRLSKFIIPLYIAVAFLCFIFYFPYSSGIPVSNEWLDAAGGVLNLYH